MEICLPRNKMQCMMDNIMNKYSTDSRASHLFVPGRKKGRKSSHSWNNASTWNYMMWIPMTRTEYYIAWSPKNRNHFSKWQNTLEAEKTIIIHDKIKTDKYIYLRRHHRPTRWNQKQNKQKNKTRGDWLIYWPTK